MVVNLHIFHSLVLLYSHMCHRIFYSIYPALKFFYFFNESFFWFLFIVHFSLKVNVDLVVFLTCRILIGKCRHVHIIKLVFKHCNLFISVLLQRHLYTSFINFFNLITNFFRHKSIHNFVKFNFSYSQSFHIFN